MGFPVVAERDHTGPACAEPLDTGIAAAAQHLWLQRATSSGPAPPETRKRKAPVKRRGQFEQGGYTSLRRKDPKILFPVSRPGNTLTATCAVVHGRKMCRAVLQRHRRFRLSPLQNPHRWGKAGLSLPRFSKTRRPHCGIVRPFHWPSPAPKIREEIR